MPRRTLSIIESAYRGTLEEQDDTVIWLSYTLRTLGADLDVLLRGNAVNYVAAGQDASGLRFGERRQTRPPRLDEDLRMLIDKGVKIFAIAEDLADRGIEGTGTLPIKLVRRSELANLVDSYDQVWHW